MNPATAAPPAPKSAEPEDDGLGDPTPPDPTGKGDPSAPPTPPAALPDDGNGEGEEPTDQLFLTADRELGVKVGGRKPDSSVLKLKGGKVDLPKSQFNRGDRFLAVTTLQVTGDNDQDTIEKLSGDVKSTSKAQSATLCGIARIEPYLHERLLPVMSSEEIGRVFDALDLVLPEGE